MRTYTLLLCLAQVDEKPTEDYSDIGGLDKQIQELVNNPPHIAPCTFCPQMSEF